MLCNTLVHFICINYVDAIIYRGNYMKNYMKNIHKSFVYQIKNKDQSSFDSFQIVLYFLTFPQTVLLTSNVLITPCHSF